LKLTNASLICTTLLAGLASCGQPVPVPAPSSSASPTSSAAPVDAADQQSVKNGCLEQLKAQAAGKIPAPGLSHPQKTTLLKVAFLGEISKVELPGNVTGYEVGMEFDFKLGKNDPGTARKLCRINLADSSVEWQTLK
jgi:hypothetical protein